MNVGLVGFGKWGKILKKNIEQFSQIKFISNTKKTYKVKKKIDWCFVATNDQSHYKIVNYFLKKKINVFCEKPLTRNLKQAKKLINLAKKNNVYLYIDHVENLKKKKITLKKVNFITRTKKSKELITDVLWKLFYHDLYLLYNHLYKKKLIVKLLLKEEKKIKFQISVPKKTFIFYYDLDNDKKMHYINKINFTSKINYLNKMISSVLKNKFKQYKENHNQSLFCIKTINMVQKKIY